MDIDSLSLNDFAFFNSSDFEFEEAKNTIKQCISKLNDLNTSEGDCGVMTCTTKDYKVILIRHEDEIDITIARQYYSENFPRETQST